MRGFLFSSTNMAAMTKRENDLKVAFIVIARRRAAHRASHTSHAFGARFTKGPKLLLSEKALARFWKYAGITGLQIKEKSTGNCVTNVVLRTSLGRRGDVSSRFVSSAAESPGSKDVTWQPGARDWALS